MKKSFEHTMPKDKMLRLVKKSITKAGLIKDKGDTLVYGAPMMTCDITVSDTQVLFEAGGAGKMIMDTCYNDVKMAYEDWLEENQSKEVPQSQPQEIQPAPQAPAQGSNNFDPDLEMKRIEVIQKYKELFDKGIITEEDFNRKKEQILFVHKSSK